MANSTNFRPTVIGWRARSEPGSCKKPPTPRRSQSAAPRLLPRVPPPQREGRRRGSPRRKSKPIRVCRKLDTVKQAKFEGKMHAERAQALLADTDRLSSPGMTMMEVREAINRHHDVLKHLLERISAA